VQITGTSAIEHEDDRVPWSIAGQSSPGRHKRGKESEQEDWKGEKSNQKT
jgi:hypothetical protein